MTSLGSKSLASDARSTMKQFGENNRPMRYESREQYQKDLYNLFKAFGKAAPFANGSLTFPRPDPHREGSFIVEDLKYCLEFIDPTAASESISRPMVAAGEGMIEGGGSTILNTSVNVSGDGVVGGPGVKVTRGLLAAYAAAHEWAAGGGEEHVTRGTGAGASVSDAGAGRSRALATAGGQTGIAQLKAEWEKLRQEHEAIQEEQDRASEAYSTFVVGLANSHSASQRARRALDPYHTALAVTRTDLAEAAKTYEKWIIDMATARNVAEQAEAASDRADATADAEGSTGGATAAEPQDSGLDTTAPEAPPDSLESGWEGLTPTGWAPCRIDVGAFIREMRAQDVDAGQQPPPPPRVQGQLATPDELDTSATAEAVRESLRVDGGEFCLAMPPGEYRSSNRSSKFRRISDKASLVAVARARMARLGADGTGHSAAGSEAAASENTIVLTDSVSTAPTGESAPGPTLRRFYEPSC